ncbi:hypothetical protein OSB04_002496 [Centaurea solstitialis]|uniref:Retrotransposon gag domain-containing protein n=1 Tax=Centaurea solstitialis TaxID=347529 RepID=A0AA38U4T8_9ASTR|nr:hypothetical protein OSB04_002496 [Centaurea solstitialis]
MKATIKSATSDLARRFQLSLVHTDPCESCQVVFCSWSSSSEDASFASSFLVHKPDTKYPWKDESPMSGSFATKNDVVIFITHDRLRSVNQSLLPFAPVTRRDATLLNSSTIPSGKNDTWYSRSSTLACVCVALDHFACDFRGFTPELLEPFAEPEKEFIKKNKKKSKARKVLPRTLSFATGDEQPMWTAWRAAPAIAPRPITKPSFDQDIKGQFLHMISELTFDGKSDSNSIVHVESFIDICDLFKSGETIDNAIRLRLFSFTLVGEAKEWLRSLEPSSIITWEQLRANFMSRFFPPTKIDKLRADIRTFHQEDDETISEAWERFKHLMNACLCHGLSKTKQVQTLNYPSRCTLDSSAGGVFMYKTPTQGYNLLEDMLIHNIDWKLDKRLHVPKFAGKVSTDFDPTDEIAAMKNKQVGCEECSEPHLTKDSPNKPMMTPEEVNFLNRGEYQGRWNNNRNFNQIPPGFFAPNQQTQPRVEGENQPRTSLEELVSQFIGSQKKINEEVGRILQTLSGRTQGELPMQTQVNPKVEATKVVMIVDGVPKKKSWTDIDLQKEVCTLR